MTLIDKAEALATCPFCGGEAYIDGTSWTTRDGKDQSWVTCRKCGTYGPSSTEAIAAWNRRAALPARGVGVKPLQWEDFGGLGAKASAFYQANYLIQWWKGEGRYEVALSYPGYQTGYDGERWHDTLDAAKAAAQADYDARILAALEPALAPTDAAQAREAAALWVRKHGIHAEDCETVTRQDEFEADFDVGVICTCGLIAILRALEQEGR